MTSHDTVKIKLNKIEPKNIPSLRDVPLFVLFLADDGEQDRVCMKAIDSVIYFNGVDYREITYDFLQDFYNNYNFVRYLSPDESVTISGTKTQS